MEDVLGWGLEPFAETSRDLAYSLAAYGLLFYIDNYEKHKNDNNTSDT